MLPVEPKLPGSAPFSSVGEQVYLAFAILIGLASGPIQASSRTLLARMCPPGKDHRVLRLLLLLRQDHRVRRAARHRRRHAATGSQRLGIATSLVFLIGGLLLLQRVRVNPSD